MSGLFWLIIGLMILGAVGFVVLPLWSPREGKPARVMAFLVVAVLSILSISFYKQVGGSQALMKYWLQLREAKAVRAELAKIKNPMDIVNKLKAHLQSHPNSPKGWYLLGQLYMGLKQYDKAYPALASAHFYQPQDNLYAVAYAQAAFFKHRQHLTPADIQMLQEVLRRQPNNIAAINLLAMNAFLDKRYQSAVNYWERLIPLFAPGSPDRQMVLKMIAKAQQHNSTT